MKNILIVDKDERSMYQIKSFSKKYTFNFFEAHNSDETMSQLRSHKTIDVILIDVMLDNEDGFELINNIRAEHKSMPIVILTTLNSKKDFVHGLKAGASDYLLKPFDEKAFVTRVLNPSTFRVATPEEQIAIVDIKTLIHAEFKKAQKGRYYITIGIVQYFNLNDENELAVENEYSSVSEYFYPGLKSIFWDTDFVLRYGNQTFLLVLPFCPRSELPIIKSKIHNYGDYFTHRHELVHYSLVSTFISYPNDQIMDFEAIDHLINNINKLKQKKLLSVNA